MEIGKHIASVVECNFGASPRKGTPRLEVMVQLDGDANETMTGYVYFKNATIARSSIMALGFDVDKKDMDELRNDPRLLTGNKVQVDIVDNGQYGLQIAWFNSLTAEASPDFDYKGLTNDLRKAKAEEEEYSPESEGETESIPF